MTNEMISAAEPVHVGQGRLRPRVSFYLQRSWSLSLAPIRHVFAKLDVNSRVELTPLAGIHDSRS
ncbi:MAG TPA: hypothetical protein VG253_00135 [Streptosporangiaceae bacterium]|jgi:hypothetical protein|nr:hypothetical protein [Streptosporangiaceae bacterium]